MMLLMAVDTEQLDMLFLPRCDDIRRSQFSFAQLTEPMGVMHDEFRSEGPTVLTALLRATADLHSLLIAVPLGPTGDR